MRQRVRGGIAAALAFCALALVPGEARAQSSPDTTDAEIAALEARLEALELKLAEQEELLRRRLEEAMQADAVGTRAAFAYGRDGAVDPRQRMVSGIYGRPFVKRFGAGTAVGGYVDLELESNLETDELAFDQHRFIPFIFAEITDRIHFGTELEFEHGAEEIKIEFAALDVEFTDWLGVRGGVVLSPLGKFNLIHDSPVNDLTERPIVNRQIIPSTLSESGIGIFGTAYPSELSVLTWEAYVVNGFDHDLVIDGGKGTVRSSPNVRSGRGSLGGDNNAAKSVVARVGYSPFLGLEVGGSLHTGVYAPGDADTRAAYGFGGDERLTIFAADAIFNRGPFEVLGEYARLSLDAPAAAGPALATTQQGYYLQGNYHFGHGLVPHFDSSLFTGVVRWDQADYNTEIEGAGERRLTLGLNWRPVEETVFKFDVVNDWRLAAGTGEAGDAQTRLFFSLATYF